MATLHKYFGLRLGILTGLFKKISKEKYIEEENILETSNGNIYGSLIIPVTTGPHSLVLILGGSGDTDRNGNNSSGSNNCLKMLAEFLAENSIASLRYDKRGIGKSRGALTCEEELRIENYIEDGILWLEKLKRDNRFSKFYIVGHSEGALIGGVLAFQSQIDGYISLAGSGRRASDLIADQVKRQYPNYYEATVEIIRNIERGKFESNIPIKLYPLFRPSIQAYLMSWFKYNPVDIIKSINSEVLIIQGDKDLQVSLEDAWLLYKSREEKTSLKIIKDMNHVLKPIGLDINSNIKSYSNPRLIISKDLQKCILEFLKK